jgi:hypothetical protein
MNHLIRNLLCVSLVALAIGLIAATTHAQAETIVSPCPKGNVLVGLEGATGAWLDTVARVCAPWNVDAKSGPVLGRAVLPGAGDFVPASANTRYRVAQCGPNQAVTAVRYGLARPDGGQAVQNLQLQCTDATSHIVSPTWHSELISDGGPATTGTGCTDPNTIAVGFSIDYSSGKIASLKLICSVYTQVVADVATKIEVVDPDSLPPLAKINSRRPGPGMMSSSSGAIKLPTSLARVVDNAGQCYRLCSSTGGCAEWTYVKRGVANTGGYCYPNTIVTAAVADSCCVSGVMPPARSSVNTDRPGSDIASFALADTNPALCANACATNAQCAAWTYTRPGVNGFAGPHCYLKAPAPKTVANNCCVSGTKLVVLQGPSQKPSANAPNAQAGGGLTTSLGKLGKLGKLGGGTGIANAGAAGGASVQPITQTLNVRCTSDGEVCNVPAALNLPAGKWSVRVSAPASHCSPIAYRVTTDNHGAMIGDTGALPPGASGGVMPVPATAHQIYVTATGIPGGCNTGRLGSWGVVIRLIPG